jgi:GT2 family glycosyltransferase
MDSGMNGEAGRKVVSICVNYNDEESTCAFVREILHQRDSDSLAVIVVDNSETCYLHPKLEGLGLSDSRVTVLKAERNLGYFGAAAWALRHYLAGSLMPGWLLVSNTDITFPESDFFVKLDRYDSGAPPAVLAPSIVSAGSGRDQNPFMQRRPKRQLMLFYEMIFRYYSLYLTYQTLAYAKQNLCTYLYKYAGGLNKTSIDVCKRAMPIYAPHGSFLLFHRTYFDAGGSLDYNMFLFNEEIFVAETVRRMDMKVLYDPSFCVAHKEHATTGIYKNRSLVRHVSRSLRYCADNYF